MNPKPYPPEPTDENAEEHKPTEEQVDMKGTVPQHSDRKGTKIEDLAGTGEQDSKGG